MLANLKTCNPEPAPQFRDAAILLRKWHAGMAPGRDMPFYEDVVLGGIGGPEVHLRVGVASIGDLLSATLTDISALKQREASFRLLFDSNPVPMWLYDLVSLSCSTRRSSRWFD
jgi:hypothetical protein